MKGINILVMLMTFLSLVVAPTLGVNVSIQVNDGKRVENMINIAEKAKIRVESLIATVESNSTLITLISNAGLSDDFNGNKTLFETGISLLNNAKIAYNSGDYVLALNYTIQALDLFRMVFRNIHVIVCKAGGCLEREDVLKAEGLIVAMNRTRERIRNMYEIEGLPEAVIEILSKAESYLDITVARKLLAEGNVSGVAHRLAEAEKLVSEAFSMIKSKAEEKVSERIEKFIVKFNETFEKVLSKAESLGVNATKVLNMFGLKGVEDIYVMKNDFVNRIKSYIKLGQFEKAINEMNKAREKIDEINREMEKWRWQFRYNFSVGVEIQVEKNIKKPFITLSVTILNTGNATIIFPNSMCGLTIEKKVGEEWKPFYVPIAAQVLTELKPGQSRHLNIKFAFEHGTYRVVIHGMCEKTFNPVIYYKEFTIP
ncbi:MAG: hypothetical protein QXO82_01420 [Candidatus Methanomethylicia archaeon]